MKDGSLVFDFTGSDPQLSSSLNMPTGGKERHSARARWPQLRAVFAESRSAAECGRRRRSRCHPAEGTIMNCVPRQPRSACASPAAKVCTVRHLRRIFDGVPRAPAGLSRGRHVDSQREDRRPQRPHGDRVDQTGGRRRGRHGDRPDGSGRIGCDVAFRATRQSKSTKPKCRSASRAMAWCQAAPAPASIAAGLER